MLWGVTSIQNCLSGTIFMHLGFLNFFTPTYWNMACLREDQSKITLYIGLGWSRLVKFDLVWFSLVTHNTGNLEILVMSRPGQAMIWTPENVQSFRLYRVSQDTGHPEIRLSPRPFIKSSIFQVSSSCL